MALTYIGELTLAVALPAPFAAVQAGISGINLALPDINARLAAFASFTPTLGNFPADIALANQIIASIQAAITAGIGPVGLDAQVALIAGLVSDLSALLGSINATLTVMTTLIGLLASGGVHAYHYSGTVGAFGAGLTTALAGGFPGGAGAGASCNALVLGTTVGATWTAMSTVFKVAP